MAGPSTRFPALAVRGAVILAVAAAGMARLAPEGTADAHSVGVSSGEYRLEGTVLYGDIGLADRELARWLPPIDSNHDGSIDSGELTAGLGAVTRALLGGMTVATAGRPCPGSLDRAWAMEADGGIVFQVRFTCPEVPGRLTLAAPSVLQGLAPGHRHLARIFRAGRAEVAVLDRAHAVWILDAAAPASSAGAMFCSMVKLGMEHIVTGLDHLVFLLGLVLVGGRLRAMLGVVTAFTVAHSITLALAALSILAPSPRLVEPAIALSIAYVGVDNLFVEEPTSRWRITFAFGLVHGFGFAGALREIALARTEVPLALVAFNLGVELGQLGVLSLALPLTLAARRLPAFRDRGVKLLSLAIAIGGAALFVTRVAGR